MASIVICDDHRLFAETVALVLAGRGHEVVGCTTRPGDGVAAARHHAPDLYLTDVRFPRADGIQGLAQVLAASPSTRGLVLTGWADRAVRDRARRAGASGFVGKDGSIERIVTAVDVVAGGGVFFDEPVRVADRPAEGSGRADAQHHLTQRERDTLDRLVRGQSTAVLAREMGVQYSTARTHIQNVLTKLGVHSKLEAVALAAGDHPDDPAHRGADQAAGELR